MNPVVQALVIDDHPAVCQLIGTILGDEGVRVRLAFSARDGFEALKAEPVDVLFVDLRLPDGDGIELLRQCLALLPKLAAVVISGVGTMDSVVDALRVGACDYVAKPIDREKVVAALHRAQTHLSLCKSGDEPAARPMAGAICPPAQVVSASPAMETVLARLARIAPTSFPILIRGETGVGKKLLARWVHSRSRFTNGPFEHITCTTALHDVDSRSETGGWWTKVLKGSLQSMIRARCAGGTLFLENVAQLPFPAQVELLDAIEGNWHNVFHDGNTPPSIVRIIASTEVDLEAALAEGKFHRGLYDALNLFPVAIPPLRERTDDIRALTTHFVDQICCGQNRNPATIRRYLSEELWDLMHAYAWPGNVRELMRVVALLTLAQDVAEADRCLREQLRVVPNNLPLPAANIVSVPLEGDLKSIERSVIREVLRRHGGNKAAAARALGMHRRTLYRILDNQRGSAPGNKKTVGELLINTAR